MWSRPRESTARLLWMPISPIESTVWIWKVTACAGVGIPTRKRTAQNDAAARGGMVAPVSRLGGDLGPRILPFLPSREDRRGELRVAHPLEEGAERVVVG